MFVLGRASSVDQETCGALQGAGPVARGPGLLGVTACRQEGGQAPETWSQLMLGRECVGRAKRCRDVSAGHPTPSRLWTRWLLPLLPVTTAPRVPEARSV